MLKENRLRCSKCHSTKDLYINSKRANLKGEIVPTYMCRPCNTERQRQYRSTETGKRNIYNAVKKSTEKHWDKQMARAKLQYHINVGHIVKPNKCSHCNLKGKIEGHHEDYSKPLDVIWVCKPCHWTYYKD
jgi:ribosomal protein S27AE